jgi:hydrogenase/urease accessory protein HupE
MSAGAARFLSGLATAAVLPALLLAVPLAPAQAHDAGATAFARITVSGQTVRYSLAIPDGAIRSLAGTPRDAAAGMDANESLARAVQDRVHLTGDTTACAPAQPHVAPPSADSVSLTLTIDFACPPSMRVLTIRDDSFDVLGSDLHILARIDRSGASEQFAFATENRETRITLATTPAASRGVGSFFALGVEHILTGYDHLLFLLALLIGGGSVGSLVRIITAFTLAHSVTLTAAALDLIVLPGRLVECAIALSIVYVALENLFLRERGMSKRWLVALAFGLVHGFGFSGVLKELGLPADGLAWSLLLFNLGVEAGQALVIAAAVPLLIGLRRVSWRPQAVGIVSVAVLAIGVVLAVERAFFS